MNENINKKFDVKNFDYDKCYEEVKENASKNINIIVCGATGVGKSSLINDFFEFDKDSASCRKQRKTADKGHTRVSFKEHYLVRH